MAWKSLEEREPAVRRVMDLKKRYPKFVWNSLESLELMLAANSKAVTDNCLPKKYLLPLYLNGKEFEVPFCCVGNDADCRRLDRCRRRGLCCIDQSAPHIRLNYLLASRTGLHKDHGPRKNISRVAPWQ